MMLRISRSLAIPEKIKRMNIIKIVLFASTQENKFAIFSIVLMRELIMRWMSSTTFLASLIFSKKVCSSSLNLKIFP